MMKPFLLLLFFLIVCFNTALAQKQIKGKVLDEKGKPVISANISVKDPDGNIVNFTRTTEKGEYSLAVKAEIKGYSIEASSIGYRKNFVQIIDLNKVYDLVLENTEIKLETVTVKNRPALKVNGDTLNYRTADFADKQDRSIGDVIRKMPGIEVAENGKISYNGKAISNFYLDGDNLLDDRYNIGTKSIPQDAVEKVQIIQNDQPLKMLRKNNMSDDVALNLVFKDEARLKLMGTANLGAGIPSRFNEDVTAMLFKKKIKFINSIKGNNVGNDPGIDLIAHNFSNNSDNDKPNSLLSTGAAGVPTLPQSRYLFNKAGLVNLNNLYNLSKDLQVKGNLYYLYDQRSQQYNKFSQTYLPDQTISYTEFQNNKINPQKLRVQLNVNENTDKNYLNNTFIADYTPLKTNSDFIINDITASQFLKQQTFDLSNNFNYRKLLKSNHMINFSSYINRTMQPESLNITPGLNADILNNGISYAAISQYVKLPTWYTDNYASFALTKNSFVQTYKMGFNFQHQELNSELYLTQNDQHTGLASMNAVNELNWQKTKFYLEGKYEFSLRKLKATLALPVSYNLINYKDPMNALHKDLQKMFVNPLLSLKYETSIENYLVASYSFKNELGGIDDVYRGTILRNYRSLFANDAPIAETKSHNFNTGFTYRKAIDMFFFNVSAGYKDATLNTISSYTLSNNIQQRVVLPLSNHIRNLNFSGSSSKYLFALKSTVSGGVSFSQSEYKQLQNNELLPYREQTLNYKAQIDAKLNKLMNLSYSANYSVSKNKALAVNAVTTNYQQLRQRSTLAITTINNLYLNLSAEHLFTHQSAQQDLKYLFADVNLKYKLLKIKTDIEFGITNLGNIKRFNAVYLSANSLTSGTYYIPGRIAMLKGTFNF